MRHLDILAIGDIATDAFIKLKEASVEKDRGGNSKICLRFAEKIPYESTEVVKAVGNSANAAVAARRLGLHSAVVSAVGLDEIGKDAIRVLRTEGVFDDYISSESGTETNYNYVLWYENDRTILIKHNDYHYQFPDISEKPHFVYLSSLGESAGEEFYRKIIRFLDNNPQTKLAFQPGTIQIKMGREKLAEIYKRTDVFCVNTGGAARISRINGDHKTLLKALKSFGPKTVIITDGPRGAYFYDGQKFLFMPPYPEQKPAYERTGAGDAFFGSYVSALALGKSPKEALSWGPVNAMSVVQYVGSRKGLLSKDRLGKYLEEAPSDYSAKEI